jgi:hypothetical protein
VTKSLYVIGGPGVGKSTAMRLAFPTMVGASPYKPAGFKLLRLTALGPGETMLGVWREDFPGTDGLSMAVLPEAVRWASEEPLPRAVVGEGQRLANVDFFLALAERSELTIAHLTASPEDLAARREGRTQNSQWQAAATTRAANVAAKARSYGLRVLDLDTSDIPAYGIAFWLSGKFSD